MTILEQLAAHARYRMEQAAKQHPPEEVKRSALALPRGDLSGRLANRVCLLSASARKRRRPKD